MLGPDGKKLSKRAEGASIASLREAGIPPEAVRAYLEELGVPKHDVRLDLARIRSLAVDVARPSCADDELAAPARRSRRRSSPLLRGAHDLNEARALRATRSSSRRRSRSRRAPRRSQRFRELRAAPPTCSTERGREAIVREVKAVGGHLRAVRQALTGRESGPELWAVLAALPRDETLRRVDAAL